MRFTTVIDSGRHRRSVRYSQVFCFRSLIALWALSAIAAVSFASSKKPASVTSSGVKAWVDRPGVYAASLDQLGRLAGCHKNCPIERLRLICNDREVPHWLDEGKTGTAPRVIFVADTDMFHPRDPRNARPLRVVRLMWDGGHGSGTGNDLLVNQTVQPRERGGHGLPEATVWQTLRLEENVLRAAVTKGDAADIDTLWYWAMLTQQSSSQLEVEIGSLQDPRTTMGLDLEVTVRLLGWSRSAVPEGTSQHHVDVFLNGHKIGEGEFDGRRPLSLHFENISDTIIRSGSNRLLVKIPERPEIGGTDPLIDIVYLDWIDVRYRASSPLSSNAGPLFLEASYEPRWLADPAGSPASRLFSAAGWTAQRRPTGGWIVPPGEATELWIVDEGKIRKPLALEPLNVGVGALVTDAEYVMIAPPELMAGAERLAVFHRSLGRTVAVTDATAVFDEFGGGERSAAAIRLFLDSLYQGSGRLRWVLLVGDADWFEPDDRPPSQQPNPADRNLIPSWTYLSRYGPAASDHFYAADSHNEARPRFAVGRLPVADPETLEAYVSKAIAWAGAPKRAEGLSMLMLSDSSKGSKLQQERMRERLADLDLDLVTPNLSSGDRDPDETTLAAFGHRPSLVYFGGHGSRYMWELGDPGDPKPESFLDCDDISRLEPTIRQPVVLSMSCGTAPFDHPSAESLGEVMVLSGSRGAVAFIGSSTVLHTPPRFAESLVRGLLDEQTVGDAFVAAKRLTAGSEVSYLYSLLGDPGLPLSTQGHDASAEEQ